MRVNATSYAWFMLPLKKYGISPTVSALFWISLAKSTASSLDHETYGGDRTLRGVAGSEEDDEELPGPSLSPSSPPPPLGRLRRLRRRPRALGTNEPPPPTRPEGPAPRSPPRTAPGAGRGPTPDGAERAGPPGGRGEDATGEDPGGGPGGDGHRADAAANLEKGPGPGGRPALAAGPLGGVPEETPAGAAW